MCWFSISKKRKRKKKRNLVFIFPGICVHLHWAHECFKRKINTPPPKVVLSSFLFFLGGGGVLLLIILMGLIKRWHSSLVIILCSSGKVWIPNKTLCSYYSFRIAVVHWLSFYVWNIGLIHEWKNRLINLQGGFEWGFYRYMEWSGSVIVLQLIYMFDVGFLVVRFLTGLLWHMKINSPPLTIPLMSRDFFLSNP